MKLAKSLAPWFVMLVGVFFLALLFLQPLSAFSQSSENHTPLPISENEKIDPILHSHLSESEPDAFVRYIIYHREQIDSKQMVQKVDDPDARHAALVEQLQATAKQSQQEMLKTLDSLQQAGSVKTYRSLWIINAVAVNGSADSINTIANRSDVARIALDESRPLVDIPDALDELNDVWQTAVTATTGDEPWGIERVQAAHAWAGLGIDGEGAIVGIMDSGVDWQHPDLLPNYRGNLGSDVYDHSNNWYDAVVPTNTVPYDVLGHGTHVAGTAVGQNGIGVAPGASWIAVNIASPGGLIFNSDAHAGFQWLLAPAGNPALAPDVVNGSWSGSGFSIEFVPDIEALDAAGIITVFAAGNNGPMEESIGAPASIMETMAIGAQDDTDNVTWFSSRGPSPLHEAYHPHFVAPGAKTLSTLPGGLYGYNNGTSMAAPHATGAVALLLSANETLSRAQVTHILTETAVPISTVHPNMDSGWGRLNVYQATAQVTPHGTLTGVVHENEQPLPGVVVTITTSLGEALPYVTDENGRYTAYLQADSYQISTAPYGFHPLSLLNVPLPLNQTTTHDLAVTRLPSGTLIVQVIDADTNLPVQAAIDILNTPYTLETTTYGTINIPLPAGSYDLEAHEAGYKIGDLPVNIAQNEISARTIHLVPTKKVLLVDTGAWYYDSYRSYFSDSLKNLGYSFDTHIVTNPFYPGFPEQSQLNEYDVLVWTSPLDSPGYIGANNVITDFLGQGGSMFISGQDIGYYDGYGLSTQLWWYRDLQARLLGEMTVTDTINGASNTPYSDLTITLNQGSSANNQIFTDIAEPRPLKFSKPIFYTEDDLPVGLQAGHCKPFRLSYLGFGLEGVTEAEDRDAILAQSFTYFDAPRQETGMAWQPEAIDDFAPPGEDLVYPIQMQHLGEIITDTYSLHVDESSWPVSLSSSDIELGPCKREVLTVTVTIPDGLPRDYEHDFMITAVSQANPSQQITIPFHHKTPGHILLVDDDRWYNQEIIYRDALTKAGLIFDEWNIGWDNNSKGSPSYALLRAFDFVIWYTGYDWFAPIESQENAALTAYLAQGGRLFLSSQDFLYYHHDTPLATTYLGIPEYQESITPTLIYRGHSSVPPNLNEPLPLTYGNFQNNSDGLIPGPYADIFTWHDQGMAASIVNQNPKNSQVTAPYRTVFFGYPFEKMPPEAHASLMNSAVGWLSDLGDSTFTVDQRSGHNNDTRTYTITLQNNPLATDNQVKITNTLPITLALIPGTLTGDGVYDAASHQIRWQGTLDTSEIHTITYQTNHTQPLPDHTRIDNALTISYERHALAFNQVTSYWVHAPDLSPSKITAVKNADSITQSVTYTMRIQNSDIAPANDVSATLYFPSHLDITNASLVTATGELTQITDHIFHWAGSLLPGESVIVTAVTTRTMRVEEPEWLTAVLYLEDGVTNPIVKSNFTYLPPFKHYFPIIAQTE